MTGPGTSNKSKTEVSFLHLFPYIYVSFVRRSVQKRRLNTERDTKERTKETYKYGKRCRKETLVLVLFGVHEPIIGLNMSKKTNIYKKERTQETYILYIRKEIHKRDLCSMIILNTSKDTNIYAKDRTNKTYIYGKRYPQKTYVLDLFGVSEPVVFLSGSVSDK